MIKNIIVIGSGKGGVGKSTVTVNLAISLAKKNLNVGLLDADIYGPSIPKMLGITEKPGVSKKKKIMPYLKYGIKSISIGNMIPDNGAVIWRGAMASSAIKQLFNDVDWGDLDYLLVDLPPGTGDIQLSLCQSLTLKGAVIVSTPQEISLIDVRKSINMFKKVNVPILGIVQNMSFFEIKGQKNYIFGKDGVSLEAKKQNLKLLGDIPILAKLSESGDNGKPITFDEKSDVFKIFEEIAEKTLQATNKTKIKNVDILS
ncbi:MAG: ATP-binding protein [Rickettsiales bacterium]|nr:ATP-binding protein [Rickettsiales bacterium]